MLPAAPLPCNSAVAGLKVVSVPVTASAISWATKLPSRPAPFDAMLCAMGLLMMELKRDPSPEDDEPCC